METCMIAVTLLLGSGAHEQAFLASSEISDIEPFSGPHGAVTRMRRYDWENPAGTVVYSPTPASEINDLVEACRKQKGS